MGMTSTDPVADMLTRIRNAIAVQKNSINLPHSNLKEEVAKVLMRVRLVESVKVEKNSESGFKELNIVINQSDMNAKITSIERLSKPGRRLYTKASNIPTVKSGRGFIVISTSKGLMTGAEAKRQGLGGELICKVY